VNLFTPENSEGPANKFFVPPKSPLVPVLTPNNPFFSPSIPAGFCAPNNDVTGFSSGLLSLTSGVVLGFPNIAICNYKILHEMSTYILIVESCFQINLSFQHH
jgi:hypothetical protein